MSAEEILTASERSALNNNQFVSHVNGKNFHQKSYKKIKSVGAVGFILVMIVIAAVIFSSGNMIPTTIYEKLIEETDTQCADMIMSKNLALQQALESGHIPDDTAAFLKEDGILVGYIDNGEFVENNKAEVALSLKKGTEIITADELIDRAVTDVEVYRSLNNATYGCAAGYYDEAANEVFKKIGTNRNNYNSDSDLMEVMNRVMGEGSDVEVNSVSSVQKTRINEETGETETYYEYVSNGVAASSDTATADFVSAVGNKNTASSESEATLNSADSLKVADTISKEQKSSVFYALFMENFSKMKAGDGNESKINEAMNYLYEKAESEVVDVKTGETIKVTGTAMDSPSIYAVLTGQKVNISEVENYSSDRILKTVENKVGGDGKTAIAGTVASSTTSVKGSIGRFISNGIEKASNAILSIVNPTVKKSLVDNSYSNIKGVAAGETLVEGAVNVGKMLAKESGATSGDAAAVDSYARLNTQILAMEAKVDRMERSPFDITSKNTFLGSIIYNFATSSMQFNGTLANMRTFASSISSAVAGILPTTYADETSGYLNSFGDCETYATIGTVGTAQCSEIAVFDTSTLNDPFHDSGFIDFVNNNTTLENGVRKIKEGSDLANFILYNDERCTPLGVIDGGILESINTSSDSVDFVTDIVQMVKNFLGASNEAKKVATGEEFVNSSSNPKWQTYKYAQRYVSLARATAILKQYSSDETAYNIMEFFEGSENPVMAFIKENNIMAKKN